MVKTWLFHNHGSFKKEKEKTVFKISCQVEKAGCRTVCLLCYHLYRKEKDMNLHSLFLEGSTRKREGYSRSCWLGNNAGGGGGVVSMFALLNFVLDSDITSSKQVLSIKHEQKKV